MTESGLKSSHSSAKSENHKKVYLIDAIPTVSYILNHVYEFRWNEWNLDHIGRHGISLHDAEYLVNHAQPPYPRFQGDGRFLVRGRIPSGYYLQVVYIFSPPGVVYVIHGRPLAENEKRRHRRGRST